VTTLNKMTSIKFYDLLSAVGNFSVSYISSTISYICTKAFSTFLRGRQVYFLLIATNISLVCFKLGNGKG